MEFSSTFRRCLCFAALSFGLPLALQAAPRTFTSPDGRTIQAEIQSATTSAVTLKLSTGPTVTAQIGSFSQADQAYIAEWRKANPVTTRYDFNLSFIKEKTGSTKKHYRNEEVTTESWICSVKLLNRSGQTLDKLTTQYEIFYSSQQGAQARVQKQAGNASLGEVKNLQETTFKTVPVSLSTYKLDAGFYYADGTRARRKDSIDGIRVKIFHEGKMVHQWESSGVPKEQRVTDAR